jgi:hypothetical protein
MWTKFFFCTIVFPCCNGTWWLLLKRFSEVTTTNFNKLIFYLHFSIFLQFLLEKVEVRHRNLHICIGGGGVTPKIYQRWSAARTFCKVNAVMQIQLYIPKTSKIKSCFITHLYKFTSVYSFIICLRVSSLVQNIS